MPIDASGVRPLGVVTRHPLDWFNANGYLDGYFLRVVAPVPQQWFAVGLHNKDNLGRVIRVWGISVSNDGGGGIQAYAVNGTFGAFDHLAQPVRFDQPIGSAEIWETNQDQLPGQLISPYALPPPRALVGTGGFDSFTFTAPFPLFIIPVGWSLVLSNNSASSVVGGFFWFEMANH